VRVFGVLFSMLAGHYLGAPVQYALQALNLVDAYDAIQAFRDGDPNELALLILDESLKTFLENM